MELISRNLWGKNTCELKMGWELRDAERFTRPSYKYDQNNKEKEEVWMEAY